jgi:hypothetical protein
MKEAGKEHLLYTPSAFLYETLVLRIKEINKHKQRAPMEYRCALFALA